MNRKKTVLLASACIVLGMVMAGPAARAADELLTAVRSTHQFYLDGKQIELEAYIINGNNYVKLADVGRALDFNVYWDGAVQIESDAPYTGKGSETLSTLEQVRQDIVTLVNGVRQENGLSNLTVDQRLMNAAQVCSDRRYTWHHTQEECEAVADAGYPYGFRSNLTVFTGAAISDIPEQAVKNWVGSPGHLQAMLDPDADSLGVGVTVEQGVTYCYLLLGDPTTNNPYG